MRRDEACWLLTKIAQNEIVSSSLSQRLYQIRDKMICLPNPAFQKIVEIDGELDADIACQFLDLLSENNLLNEDVQSELVRLIRCIHSKRFKDCEEMIYRDRCKGCPAYKGETR